MTRPKIVGGPIVLFVIAWLGVMGLITFVLWNRLIPTILRLPSISFWQALGLYLLSRVLFGRFDGLWSRARRARVARGWTDLTPEERERFRNAMQQRH